MVRGYAVSCSIVATYTTHCSKCHLYYSLFKVPPILLIVQSVPSVLLVFVVVTYFNTDKNCLYMAEDLYTSAALDWKSEKKFKLAIWVKSVHPQGPVHQEQRFGLPKVPRLLLTMYWNSLANLEVMRMQITCRFKAKFQILSLKKN